MQSYMIKKYNKQKQELQKIEATSNKIIKDKYDRQFVVNKYNKHVINFQLRVVQYQLNIPYFNIDYLKKTLSQQYIHNFILQFHSLINMSNQPNDQQNKPSNIPLTGSNDEQKNDDNTQVVSKSKVSKSKLIIQNVFINSKKSVLKSQIKQKNQNQLKKQIPIMKPQKQQENQIKNEKKIIRQVHKTEKNKGSKNPLIPIKNSIKIFQQFQEEFNSANELLSKFQKYKFSANKQITQIKIQQCMTLSFVKKLKNNGCIKKILHPTTFKVYYIEEQPINLKDDKIIIQEWLELWEKCPTNDHQLKTYGLYWNTPQGFLSIIYECPPYKSLKELNETAGYLPQNVIQSISKDLINGIQFLQRNKLLYKNIEETEFLLGEGGKIKFYPNLELDSKNWQQKYGNTIINTLLNLPLNQKQTEIDKMVFKFGFMIFKFAVGSLCLEDQLFQVFENIIKNIKKQNCCILHSLQKYQNNLSIYEMFKRKWSKQFKDFLCATLKYDYRLRSNLINLANHRFITQNIAQQKVQLIDLIQLTKQSLPTFKEIVKKGGQIRLQNIFEAFELILATAQAPQNLMIKKDNIAIMCLAQETGLEAQLIVNKVNKFYNEINK